MTVILINGTLEFDFISAIGYGYDLFDLFWLTQLPVYTGILVCQAGLL